MPTDLEASIVKQVDRLARELDKRKAEHERIKPYAQRIPNRFPVPEAVASAKLVRAYTLLMDQSVMPWGKLVVSSKLDRLEVNGVTSPDKMVSEAVWEQVWQENALDMESKLAHRASLMDGRSHATVWPQGLWLEDEEGVFAGGSSEGPRVRLDDCSTMIVEYAEGSRQDRVGALRRWCDEDDQEFATLYRRDGIFKFQATKSENRTDGSFMANGTRWIRRDVEGEDWPLPNPLGVVPVVELAVNRELAPGRFAVCRGEFSDETGLIDRVNLLTFLGLCVAVSMSFPLRLLIGEKILKDDEDNIVPPFDAHIGGLAQLENPEAKIAEYKAADRGALSIYDELAQLAAATSTPRHYFPNQGAISNVSAETIRAFEGPLHAAVNGSHKPSLGEGWEEVLRLGGLMLPDPVKLSRRATLEWADHESRSLAERADAFSKLSASGLPWQASAELALSLGNDAIRRYEADEAMSPLSQIIGAARDKPQAQLPAGLPVAA